MTLTLLEKPFLFTARTDETQQYRRLMAIIFCQLRGVVAYRGRCWKLVRHPVISR
ncbi:hypothetical protein KCP70_04520 [Salmonella enterica subsp. enterica]|nr:hypothetical protein KCP70_04520 [Salmonella enterica subsp. enterica]